MGLLDDAIREHMELKRLRGADPTEVAQQEQDALGPVLREENEQDAATQKPQGAIAEPDEVAPAASAGEDSSSPPEAAHDPDFANVGQETAELDMRTVLDEERDIGDTESHPDPTRVARETDDTDEPAEDVLEETPDFLRDTPEQERLWFEQQPPRDFDFDK
jgi:hypothetical protein